MLSQLIRRIAVVATITGLSLVRLVPDRQADPTRDQITGLLVGMSVSRNDAPLGEPELGHQRPGTVHERLLSNPLVRSGEPEATRGLEHVSDPIPCSAETEPPASLPRHLRA